MEIFECETVTYKVFELRDYVKGIELINYHEFYFTRPTAMINELICYVEDFIEYIYSRNLQSYFERKKPDTKP